MTGVRNQMHTFTNVQSLSNLGIKHWLRGCCCRSVELKQTKVKAESGVKENQALIMSVENPVHRILFLHAFFT